MDNICIYDHGTEISRIVFSRRLPEVVSALDSISGNSPRLPVYVIYDRNIAGTAAAIADLVSRHGRLEMCGQYGVDATEENKTLSTVQDMAGWLLECGADRNAFVLAVGGGITTDMAGFAASIYKRGVRFAYIPTTLLSQVDAAIGGKTGVNYESYKNMLGLIRQPEFTFICPEVLSTLPLRDFLSGAAELVKSFLIDDGGFYRRSVTFLAGLHGAAGQTDFLEKNRTELLDLIHAAAAVKAGIVSRDQFETGERRKLNLGHTFAHAIEKNARTAGDDITHGEAVSMGMVMAARLSVRAGLADCSFAEALTADFRAAGLPVDCPYSVSSMAEAMSKDKKAENGLVNFVLPVSPGDVRICAMTVSEASDLLIKKEL